MNDHPLRILQISTADIAGGAEKIGWDLHNAYRRADQQSWLAVGIKQSDDPDVFPILNRFQRCVHHIPAYILKKRGINYIINTIDNIVHPSRVLAHYIGYEDFDYQGIWNILNLVPQLPDIIHAHNLHNRYFDLRALPWISHHTPTVLTLHDAWLLSGHCAHSFACERWRTGCGNCPDLSIYPKIRHDVTAFNWKRKADIYKKSRLCVVTPSQWLMNKVNQSMLMPGIIKQKVIPNGVDQSVFHPVNQKKARNTLNLPSDAMILLFAAHGIRKNIWKDYKTLQSTLVKISATGIKILCIALGEKAPPEHLGSVEIRFIPYQHDPQIVARYFQAADIYVHPALAEVWGLTITEALSCGIPVVTNNIGGIPEQIKEGKTGFLVPVGDSAAMTEKILFLIKNEDLRQQIGQQAANDAAQRFGLQRMAGDYLTLYQSLINS